MRGEIFISYRREESGWVAGRLRDRLHRDFDAEKIFMDIDAKAIPLGANFKQVIEKKVGDSDVLIAVIGKNWLSTTDDSSGRRLDNPEDFVRLEIGTALKRKICVIPVLVDGVKMPRSTDLPEDLRPLVWLNALSITAGTYFDVDCQRLTDAIRQVLEKVAAKEQERLAAEQRQREEAEARQREEKERLAAEQREKERLEAEQREKERENAEQREKERLAAEQRQRAIARKEGKGLAKRKPFAPEMLFMPLGVVLFVGLIWFVSRGGREPTLVPPTPTPESRPALSAAPDSSEAAGYYATGIVDFQRGFYADAVRDFSRAINSSPTAAAYYHRGMSYRREGNEAQAQADFDKAKQLGYTGP